MHSGYLADNRRAFFLARNRKASATKAEESNQSQYNDTDHSTYDNTGDCSSTKIFAAAGFAIVLVLFIITITAS
jgi:hypothetical protein